MVLGLVGEVPGVCLTGVQERNIPQGSLQPHLSPSGVYAGSSYTHGFYHFAANLFPVHTLQGSSCDFPHLDTGKEMLSIKAKKCVLFGVSVV